MGGGDDLLGNKLFALCFGFGGKTAINAFVLITGFFMCKKEFHWTKVVNLFCLMVFYRWFIYALFIFSGYEAFSVSELAKTILFIPRDFGHGFASSFLGLYLLVPFLNKALQNFGKKRPARAHTDPSFPVHPAPHILLQHGLRVYWVVCRGLSRRRLFEVVSADVSRGYEKMSLAKRCQPRTLLRECGRNFACGDAAAQNPPRLLVCQRFEQGPRDSGVRFVLLSFQILENRPHKAH